MFLAGAVAAPVAAEPVTLIGTETGFDGANAPVLSPDGRHLYISEYAGNQVEVRSVRVADLVSIPGGAVTDGVDADGLEGPGIPAFDPIGRHLYVPAQDGDGVSVFARDPATGLLTYVEVQRDGFGNVLGLADPSRAAVSPDGKHVYVAGSSAVVVFTRDAGDGSLAFASKLDLPTAADDTTALAMSADGDVLYLGTDDGHLYVLGRSAATGALSVLDTETSEVGGVPQFSACIDFVLSADGRHLYASTASYPLLIFERDASGAVSFIDQTGFNGSRAHLAIARDGRRIFASYFTVGGYIGYALSTALRDPETGLISDIAGLFTLQQGADGGFVTLSRDDEMLFVSDSALDSVYLVAIAPLSYRERYGDGIAGFDGLDGARSVAASPDGRHLYVAAYTDDSVASFARNAATGAVSFVEVDRDGIAGVDGLNGASDVAVSPDGKQVYAAGFLADAIAVFSRDATTGALAFVQSQKDGIGGVEGLDAATAVALSADGKHVYVAGYSDDAVAVFARDATTGALAFVQSQKDGVSGVDGLAGASDVVVSPDGEQVFVTAYDESKVANFTRNPTTGALAYVGANVAIGLDRPAAIAIAPEGRHVYVANRLGNSVSRFSNLGSGTLIDVDAVGTVAGLALEGARGLAIAPDGRHVIVACDSGDRIAALRRDPINGRLFGVQLERDGAFGGAESLAGAWAVGISPDGRNTYVASDGDDALSVFVPEPSASATYAAALLALAALSRRHLRSID